MNPTHFQILKISKQTSHYTKKPVFAVFFKGSDGASYKSWLDPGNGNYKRWESFLKVGNILKGLRVKEGRLIDADSYPVLVPQDVKNPDTAQQIAEATIDETGKQQGLF